MDKNLILTREESHYLARVLRLKKGDLINVVNGYGCLWEASFQDLKSIQINSSFQNPLRKEEKTRNLLCLAVVIPKRGFDEVLRMSCEMGIDIIQPLTSKYKASNGRSFEKISRWSTIIKEAVEQSERLWAPEILPTIEFKSWLKKTAHRSASSIAMTRDPKAKEIQLWLGDLNCDMEEVWVAIGPEGGWSLEEIALAYESGCESVCLGDNILRTSTAAIAASHLMVAWRRSNYFQSY
tara:strand:- start:11205 stop:11918 length:714 start_codon:yes stop_codon:yes gene_type:complete